MDYETNSDSDSGMDDYIIITIIIVQIIGVH